MGDIISRKNKTPVPVSDQIKLINYARTVVKESGIFDVDDIELNYLDADKNSMCLRLDDNGYKDVEYVDGSYSGVVSFILVWRKLNINNSSERELILSKINKFGEYLSNLNVYNLDDDNMKIYDFKQMTVASLLYRGNSGTEDNGATFAIEYEHS